MYAMVTLQALNSNEHESEACNENENKPYTVDNNNDNFLMSNCSSLPTCNSSISDFSNCYSSVNDEAIDDNSQIIEIKNNEDGDEMEHKDNIISDTVEWVQKIQHETSNGQVLPNLDNTSYGEVCITNSTNVRVGNTTLYKGPVTIKQFVYTNSNSVSENDGEVRTSNPLSNHISAASGDSKLLPVYQEYDKARKWLWTWRCAAILCILGLICITVIVVLTVMLTQNSEFSPNFSPAIDPDDILTDNVRFIQRVEWGAQPPESPSKLLSIIPAPYVIISHTASEACYNQAECIQRVRLAQTMHIEGNKWSDIGYNFLVGGDGLIYVGRGWDIEGAHAFGFNTKSIGISLIGTFNKIVPPARQLHALSKLIDIGVTRKKIREDYKLLGHRQVSETLSPGNMLYGIIKEWDHWSEKP